jgi:hypothetical protein
MLVLNYLMIQNCMEFWRDKKGCDDVSGVWGEVGVWWDFDGTLMTQMQATQIFADFFKLDIKV